MIPKKILAMKLRAMGDTVLMTAPLLELRRAYPSAEIHVAALARWAPLLKGNPAVDQIFTYERHKDAPSRAKALAKLALKLRRERYDLVLNFHASPSSSTVCFATGARVRSIHFHGHRDKDRYSTVKIAGKGVLKPIIERDMDTIRAIGIQAPAGKLPQLFVQPAEEAEAKSFLVRSGLVHEAAATPLLAIGLGASRPTKMWPIEYFVDAAIAWCRRQNGSTLVIAGPAEQDLAEEFSRKLAEKLAALPPEDAERLGGRICLQSNLQVRQLAALLQEASVYLGNDSGPKHVAVAVGTPTVTLFGPEHPFEWHPYPLDKNPYFFIETLACRRDADPGMPPWCGLHQCVAEAHRCMTSIAVEEVISRCQKVAS